MAEGIVKFSKTTQGWGAVSCAELPVGQDVFVHFSVIDVDGYRELDPGDVVELEYEPGRQDSFSYVATRVRRRPNGDGARERPSR